VTKHGNNQHVEFSGYAFQGVLIGAYNSPSSQQNVEVHPVPTRRFPQNWVADFVMFYRYLFTVAFAGGVVAAKQFIIDQTPAVQSESKRAT
jgi:hypothetical protein